MATATPLTALTALTSTAAPAAAPPPPPPAVDGEWVFQPSEVEDTGPEIGRGAFGVVRVARWRSILVACKRLHAAVTSDAHAHDVLEDMHAEMEILSKLRHPNLVLFLGVCVDTSPPPRAGDTATPLTALPTMILTELMPCSLYDIVEVHHVRLTLPEVLDVALDVACGLHYLHSHAPPIVHRDISAKNILIGGSRAKIADLGQAKLFGTSALSRQTALPGAMAYSAPEVLTGKYSTKIDVFSLGVLLVQLVIGEYPRIEKREEQLARACDAFQGVFAPLLSACIDFIPANRPDAECVVRDLEAIKFNDRHYPPLRLLPPQSDVGIMARKWVSDTVDAACEDARLSFSLASAQLAAEQQRWLEEAARVDELRRTLSEKDDALAVVTAADEEKEAAIARLNAEVARLSAALAATTERLERTEEEKHNVRERLKEEEVKHHLESVKVARAAEALKEADAKADALQRAFAALKAAETTAGDREKETKMYLDIQVEQNRELEARLEQALSRWKLEKEAGAAETEKYIKMRSTSATLVEQLTHATTEIEQLNARLGQYDNLPLPDEIRVRFRDMTADVDRLTEGLGQQRARSEVLLNERDMLDSALREAKAEVADLGARLQAKTDEAAEKGRAVSSLNSRLAAANQEIAYSKRRIGELEEENVRLEDSAAELAEKLRDVEERLQLEVRRAQIRASIAATNAAASAGASRAPSRGGARPGTAGGGADAAAAAAAAASSSGGPDAATEAKDGSAEPDAAADGADGADDAVDPLANLTEDELIALENKKRPRTERELKREVAHATTAGATALVTLLRENMDSEILCWRVPRALREVAIKDEGARKECVDQRCEELLLHAMTAHPHAAVVQAQALRLLGTLAFGNDHVRRVSGERGVVRMVVYAIQRHGDEDESVLLHACTALTNLMHNSIENRARLLEHGGAPLLVRMMDVHKNSAAIQRQICWTVLTLAGSDDASRAVVEAGGASAIVNAMVQFRADAGVQQFGCWALGNLAMAGDDNRRKLRKVGALEVARMAVEQHPGDLEVVRQARQLGTALGAK